MDARTGPGGRQGELGMLRRRVRELETEVAELRRAAEAPGRSEATVRALLDGSMDRALLLAPDGRILAANETAARAFGRTRDDLVGRNAYELEPPELAESRRAVMAELLRTGEPAQKDGVRDGRSLESRLQPILNDEGEVFMVAAYSRDVSEQKEAQRLAQESQEAERRFREQLRALHEVTVGLSKAETFDDLCWQAVELGLSRLGFGRLGLWFTTADRGIMAGSFGTDERGNVRDERSRTRNVIPEDVVTNILQEKQTRPLIQGNVALRDDTGRNLGEGMRAVAGMWDGERVIGFLAMDNLLSRQPLSENQCELLGLYASAVGHLASRVRAAEEVRQREAAERDFREQFAVLHEITIELSRAETFDELCRQAVELARGRLGTDRLGMWFLTGEQDEVRGSFGTDAEGKTTDERDVIGPVAAASSMGKALADQTRLAVLDDADLHDAHENVLGRGTVILASLWDGERIIGCLCGDNLLTGRAISAAEREVIGLYASTVGHLCSRIRAEQALRESEQRYRTLIDTCPDGIVTTTVEGKFLSANQAYLDILGYTAEEFEDVTYKQFTPQEWRHVDVEGIPELLEKGFGVREKEYLRRDGSRVRVSLTGWVIRDSEGKPEKLGAFVRDVTEERRAQEALAESEARYRGLVANIPGAVYRLVLGPEPTVLFLSDGAKRITGYPVSDFIGRRARRPESIVHPDDLSIMRQTITQAVETGKPYKAEYRILHADGGVRWMFDQGAAVFDSEGQPLWLDGVLYDITEAKNTEQELQESRDRLEYVINNTSDIMFEIDLKGNYTFSNLAAEKVTGYPLSKLLKMNMRELTAPEHHDFVFQRLARRMQGKPLEQPFSFEIVHRKGHRVMLETTTTGVYDDGKLVGVQGIARDVTQRTRSEQALREARARLARAREGERRRLAGELHDSVGQGLIAIQLGMRGVLGELNALDGADPSIGQTVEALCGQTDALLDEVRRVVRGLYPPTLESLGLCSALYQLVQDFASQSTVKLECSAPEDLGRLPAEVEIALFRVAQEAITNAVRHGNARRVQVGLSYEADQAVLTVTDNGKGFDPAKAAGKGVGLARMRERTQTVSGQLKIESRKGRTRVTAFVPTGMPQPGSPR